MSKKQEQPQQIQLDTLPSEQLALMLNQWYSQIMQCQQNILAVNRLLEQRQLAAPKGK
jgi:hypothetical protein